MSDPVIGIRSLGFPYETPDPFLFCVYHKDDYPVGDAEMQAPRRGDGADFNPNSPYRMYHGDRIPGFPQHPHRGFETITATVEGIIDHCDSVGNAGRYGQGDLQWMTAGKGIVHSEMFPLINTDAPNPTRFFQIWLNLPSKSKMVDPHFVMHWGSEIPKVQTPDGSAQITVWAGSLLDVKGLSPPPNSWAADEQNEVAVWHIVIAPGGTFQLPACTSSGKINRNIYFIEGKDLKVGSHTLNKHSLVELRGNLDVLLHNPNTQTSSEVLLLQGKPIDEPVAKHGPFVMNTQSQIQQAFADYQRTQFGGWPWERDDPVFPRNKGRFALFGGAEHLPPN